MLRRFLLLAVVAAPPLVVLACNDENPPTEAVFGNTPPATTTTTPASTTSTPASDAAPAPISSLPGDPPGGGAQINVTINGEAKAFTAQPGSIHHTVDGSTSTGFKPSVVQTGGWIFNMSVDDGTPGDHDCWAGASVTLANNGNQWGGFDGKGTCTVTMQEFGTKAGDRIKGTFKAELEVSSGAPAITHFSLTDGTFDFLVTTDLP